MKRGEGSGGRGWGARLEGPQAVAQLLLHELEQQVAGQHDLVVRQRVGVVVGALPVGDGIQLVQHLEGFLRVFEGF